MKHTHTPGGKEWKFIRKTEPVVKAVGNMIPRGTGNRTIREATTSCWAGTTVTPVLSVEQVPGFPIWKLL